MKRLGFVALLTHIAFSTHVTATDEIGLHEEHSAGATLSSELARRLRTTPAPQLLQELVAESQEEASAGAPALDIVWPRIEVAVFAMGSLLSETQLTHALNSLKSASLSMNDVIVDVFWLTQGDRRIPRRVAASTPNTAYERLIINSESPNELTRALALAALTQIVPPGWPNDTGLAPEQIDALAALLTAMPSSDVIANILRETIVSVRDASNSADTSEVFIEPYLDMNDFARLLSRVHPDQLWIEFDSEKDSERRYWLAKLAIALRVTPEYEHDVPGSYKAYALLNIALAEEDLDTAYSIHREALDLAREDYRCAQSIAYSLNALGMALARVGTRNGARTVFDALATLYPDSQISNFAAEHAGHLEKDR